MRKIGPQGSGMRGRNVHYAQSEKGRTTPAGTIRATDRRGVFSVVEEEAPIGVEWVCTPESTDSEER